jgi:hypothetical protein
METRLEKLQSQKYLLISLVATGLAFLVAESFGQETATLFTNLIFIPVPASVVILSGIITKRNGLTGSHGKAWIVFTIFATMWFIAEQVWLVNELIYKEKPFPSSADLFYLLGYPFYFIFSFLYIRPFKNTISKKMIVTTSVIAAVILIPNLYMTLVANSEESEFTLILGSIYPIADAIVLIPAMIGVVLFFRGKVNFLWSLLLIGMIFEVAADTGFQYITLDDSYYTGHPIDILFLWSYLLFSFGLYDNIKIFKKSHDKKNTFDNKEDLI